LQRRLAKRLARDIAAMWAPLRQIQAEDAAKRAGEEAAAELAERRRREGGYEAWRAHVQKSRTNARPRFTPRGNSYKIDVSGITPRANGASTPRSYSKGRKLYAGANHALMVHHSGQLYAWGSGGAGRLGLDVSEGGDPRADVTVPTLVMALGGKPVVVAAAGFAHSAAVTAGRELYMWGSAASGKLGVGNLPPGQGA